MSDDDFKPSLEPSSGPVAVASVVSAGPTWQEQDMLLRDLWTQNKTPQQISDVLKRSIAAVMTRAARLGLPRRAAPGRKPGSRRVLPEGEVRLTAPRPAVNKNTEGCAEPQTSTRICLMCLRAFPSLGRHNRICPSCKNSSEYASAVTLSEINIPV